MTPLFTRGYTTGVFDCLHVGHIRLLKRAKERVHHLVVGVSTDELVLNYKNKLPLQSLAERIEIVSSIVYVDEVVVQYDRMNKASDCLANSCDCMLVGDDWKGSDLFLALQDQLSHHNIQLLYIPYTTGISSTIYRERLDRDS